MIRFTTITLLALMIILMSCGRKEESSTCSDKIRKEYKDDNIKAKVEEGCITKYVDANSYKITGNAEVTVAGDTLSKKSITLSRGELITSSGMFIIKSNEKTMKIRLLEGKGNVIYGKQNVDLVINKVLEIGK